MENDPRNDCVGCGPANEHGLRLRFETTETGARAAFHAAPHLQGWPGRLHSGMLYTAMLETANWSLFASVGRVGLPTSTGALEASRWVATGETLSLEGACSRQDDGTAHVVVEAFDAAGKRVAKIERRYALPDRKTFLAKMGYDEVPPGFEDLIPE